MRLIEQMKTAVSLAQTGDWDGSHRIVQEYSEPLACWIHAVLHKIEGDEWNSRYWYGRTQGNRYEDFADPGEELQEIGRQLEASQ